MPHWTWHGWVFIDPLTDAVLGLTIIALGMVAIWIYNRNH